LFKSPFPEEEAQEPSPITQEQQGRLPSWQQVGQVHEHKEKPVETTKVDERPTLKMPASISARRKQFVELPGVHFRRENHMSRKEGFLVRLWLSRNQ